MRCGTFNDQPHKLKRVNQSMLPAHLQIRKHRVLLGIGVMWCLSGFSSALHAQDQVLVSDKSASMVVTQEDSSATMQSSIVADSTLSVSSNTAQDKSITPQDATAATNNNTYPAQQPAINADLPISSLIASDSSQKANTTDTPAENTSLQDAQGATYPDSMIKPSRAPTLHLFSTKRDSDNEAADTVQSTSLVDIQSEKKSPACVVIYFAAPEEVHFTDVDSLSGASLIEKDQQRTSITGFLAQYIGNKVNAPVYRLQTVPAYSEQHDALIAKSIEQANNIAEQNYDLKVIVEPELNLNDVEQVFIGFPLWWNDLPAPIYAFLQQQDLSGKTIVPFCTYSANAPYRLFDIFKKLEPNAKIQRGVAVEKARLVHHNKHRLVDRWLEDLKK